MDEQFMDYLEEKFIDIVFSGNKTIISKEQFLNAIAGKDSILGSINLGKQLVSKK